MKVDPQDPLPENSFAWRRWFAWFTNIVTLAGVAWIIWRIEDAEHLKEISFGLIGLNAANAFWYMIAPSAVDVAKTVGAVKLFKQQPFLAPGRRARAFSEEGNRP